MHGGASYRAAERMNEEADQLELHGEVGGTLWPARGEMCATSPVSCSAASRWYRSPRCGLLSIPRALEVPLVQAVCFQPWFGSSLQLTPFLRFWRQKPVAAPRLRGHPVTTTSPRCCPQRFVEAKDLAPAEQCA